MITNPDNEYFEDGWFLFISVNGYGDFPPVVMENSKPRKKTNTQIINTKTCAGMKK